MLCRRRSRARTHECVRGEGAWTTEPRVGARAPPRELASPLPCGPRALPARGWGVGRRGAGRGQVADERGPERRPEIRRGASGGAGLSATSACRAGGLPTPPPPPPPPRAEGPAVPTLGLGRGRSRAGVAARASAAEAGL